MTYKSLLKRSYGRAQITFNPPIKTCNQGGTDWIYCVHKGPNTDSKSFLYVLHGKGGNENFWYEGRHYTGLLQQHWQKQNRKIPLVITVSFGGTWLVTKKMSKPNTGLMERFRTEVFPVIESQLGQPKQRMLLGNSMGALNALTISLDMNQHFSKVAALCPPIFALSPYDRWQKVVDFTVRTGAHPASVATIIGLGRQTFANSDEWLKFSPLEKIRTVQFQRHQKFYITAGTHDKFGLFEGVDKFVQGLRATAAVTEWRPNSGGHCAVDIPSLANFLWD